MADAEERARQVLGEAEARAKSVTEDTERHLREEITRLESIRTQLAGDVETIARHMENERNRLRGALGDMLTWVDEHVQPAGSILAQRPHRPRLAPRRDAAARRGPGGSGRRRPVAGIRRPRGVGRDAEAQAGPPWRCRATPPPADALAVGPTSRRRRERKASCPSTARRSPRPIAPR